MLLPGLRYITVMFAILVLLLAACSQEVTPEANAAATDEATEVVTDEATEAATEEATEVATETEEASEAPTEAATTAPTEEAQAPSIVGLAISNDDLSTLATAIVRAGLSNQLNGEGSFTVFAPTNEAFEAALTELDLTAAELMGNTELLTSILSLHVVEGAMMSGDLEDGQELTTLNGATVTVTIEGSTVKVNGATVVTADIEANNGVVHVIDTVLMPPGDE